MNTDAETAPRRSAEEIVALEAVAEAAEHWLLELGPGMHVNTASGKRRTRDALDRLEEIRRA